MSFQNKIQGFAKLLNCNFLFIFVSFFISFCSKRKELVDHPLYEGPISGKDSITTLMSDSARIILQMKADRENSFENGDIEWSQGLFLESYGDEGEAKTTFRANYVYFTQKDNLYRAEGNVVVKNVSNGDELNTEELFWDPANGEFHTEKFVTIKSEDEILSGEGLIANQNFTSYRIINPTGSFTLEEDPALH